VTAGLFALFLAVQPQMMAAAAGPAVRRGRWTAALVLVQWAAGMANVLLLAPVWMQIVHLLVADLLWIAFVLLAAAVLAEGAEGSPALAPAAAPSRAV
jgi:heme A synthase